MLKIYFHPDGARCLLALFSHPILSGPAPDSPPPQRLLVRRAASRLCRRQICLSLKQSGTEQVAGGERVQRAAWRQQSAARPRHTQQPPPCAPHCLACSSTPLSRPQENTEQPLQLLACARTCVHHSILRSRSPDSTTVVSVICPSMTVQTN